MISDIELVSMFSEARRTMDLPSALRYVVIEADRRRKEQVPSCLYAVLDELAVRYGTTREAILARSYGTTKTPPARLAAWWLLHNRFGISYPRLGEIFGGRDHSTILKLVARFNEIVKADEALYGKLSAVEAIVWAAMERKAA